MKRTYGSYALGSLFGICILIGVAGGIWWTSGSIAFKLLESERNQLETKRAVAVRDRDSADMTRDEAVYSKRKANEKVAEAEERRLAAQKEQKKAEKQYDEFKQQHEQLQKELAKTKTDLHQAETAKIDGQTMVGKLQAMLKTAEARLEEDSKKLKQIQNALTKTEMDLTRAEDEHARAQKEAKKAKDADQATIKELAGQLKQVRIRLATSVIMEEMGEKPESRLALIEKELAGMPAEVLDQVSLRFAKAKLLVLSAQQLQHSKEQAVANKKMDVAKQIAAQTEKQLSDAEKVAQESAELAEKENLSLLFFVLFLQGSALEQLGDTTEQANKKEILEKAQKVLKKAQKHSGNDFKKQQQCTEALLRIEATINELKKASPDAPQEQGMEVAPNELVVFLLFTTTFGDGASDELAKKLIDIERQIEKNPSPSLYQTKASLHLDLQQPNLAVQAAILGLEKLQLLRSDDVTRGPIEKNLIQSIKKAEQLRSKKSEERAKTLEEKNSSYLKEIAILGEKEAQAAKERALAVARRDKAEKERQLAVTKLTEANAEISTLNDNKAQVTKERDLAVARRDKAEKERQLAVTKLTEADKEINSLSMNKAQVAKERDLALALRDKAEKEHELAVTRLTKISDELQKATKLGKALEIQLTEKEEQRLKLQTSLTQAESNFKDVSSKLQTALLRLEKMSEGITPLNQRGLIVVEVPPDAILHINDKPHHAPGETSRQFMLPRLDPAKTHEFTLRMEIVREGKTIKSTQIVPIQSGTEVKVSFSEAKNAEPGLPLVTPLKKSRALVIAEVPVGVRLYVNNTAHPVTNTSSREFITARIDTGKDEILDLRAEGTTKDGRSVNVSRRVICQAGSVVVVSLQN